jgi:hypothetical protein
MVIIRARISPPEDFFKRSSKMNKKIKDRYNYKNNRGHIKSLIKSNDIYNIDFIVDDNGRISAYSKRMGNLSELFGKKIPIIDDKSFVILNEDGTYELIESTNENLVHDKTKKQLEYVMKLSHKTDIGNRISDMNKEGSNIDYIRNPIYTGIESYEDFEKKNKKFIPCWNLKHLLSPYENTNSSKKTNESVDMKENDEKTIEKNIKKAEKQYNFQKKVSLIENDTQIDDLTLEEAIEIIKRNNNVIVPNMFEIIGNKITKM